MRGRVRYIPLGVCLLLCFTAGTIPWAWGDEAADRVGRGRHLVARGQYELALQEFARALELRPADPQIRRELAETHFRWAEQLRAHQSPERARDQYHAALVLLEDLRFYQGLGQAHLLLRDTRSAIDAFLKAARLDSRNALTFALLGQAYYQKGDLGEALSHWEQALRLDPGNQVIARRLDEVRRESRVESRYGSRESQHFRLLYEGTHREDVGREIAAVLERAYTDVGYALNAYPRGEVPVIIYGDQDFRRVTGAPHWAGGLYSQLDGKIRLPARGVNVHTEEFRATLYHEYTHAVVYAITRGRAPRWLNEGLAMVQERSPRREFLQLAAEAARGGRLIPLGSLDAVFSQPNTGLVYLGYAQGYAAVTYLIERYGMTDMQRLLQRLGEGQPFESTFMDVFRVRLSEVDEGLQDFVKRRY